MDSGSLLAASALFLSLLLYAALHLAEAALVAVQRGRGGDSQAQISGLSISQVPGGLLTHLMAGARLGTVMAAILASVALLLKLLPGRWDILALMGAGALALFGLIRVGARARGVLHAARLARPATLLVLGLWWAARPLYWLVGRFSKSRAISPTLASEPSFPVEGALGDTLAPGQEMLARLDDREQRMVLSILRMERTTVREIMVPRVDILALTVDAPISTVVELVLKGGHGRIPVYEESIDHVVGVVYARDLLRFLEAGAQPQSLREILRDPYFVPEYKRLDDLLREFQERRVHIALVVDEYGGTEGLVTIEDLLEEIVGDIQDEFAVGQPEVEMVGEGEAVLDALVGLEQINQLFNANLEGVGFATLGGFLYYSLGKIPSPGDEVIADGLKLQVLSTVGRRIRKVRVTRLPQGDTEGLE